jgi:hypothetical protein
VRGRLDDEKLETLRGWGTGLAADGRDEFRAAGKAILILIDEIERLQVDVWHAQDGSAADAPPRTTSEEHSLGSVAESVLAPVEPAAELDSTLRMRVRRLLDRRLLKSR